MDSQLISYQQAKKKVSKIKSFYKHLIIYCIANLALFLIKWQLFTKAVAHGYAIDGDFLQWADWNIISTPIIWGSVLFVHWVAVFNLLFLKNWEHRQIQKHIGRTEGL